MIPPPAQRTMSERAGSTVVEVAGSHAVYVSQPAAVADLIRTAANGLAVSSLAGSAAEPERKWAGQVSNLRPWD